MTFNRNASDAFDGAKGQEASAVDAKIKQDYARFFQTHIDTNVTHGLLREVSVQDIAKLGSDPAAGLEGIALSDASRRALVEHSSAVMNFARKANVDKVLLTADGTWVVPPKLRPDVAGYTHYLNSNYDQGQVVGTSAITLAQNQPIPVFENGEQVGGFENGDFHGFLTITDRRTGEVHELHQTFLENSDDPALRPGIVNVNWDLARERGMSREQTLELIKSPETKLESVGMLDGRNTEIVSYACELTRDIDAAANWNNGVRGGNFNYVPIAAIEMPLTSQQLGLLLFDRELAGRECSFQPAAGCDIQDQNAEGFEPLLRESVYPDGTPRYVMVERKEVDGEIEVVFSNASGTEQVPPGAERHRVQEYATVVAPNDMQVVEPYNHWGKSRSEDFKASNCFGTCLALLDGVSAAGEKGAREVLGIKQTSESGIQRMLAKLLLIRTSRVGTQSVDGPVSGDINLYRTKDRQVTVYDFCSMGRTVLASAGGMRGTNLQGLSGKAVDTITAERQAVVANAERPPENELTLLPVGATGAYLKQCHERLYGRAPALQRGISSNPDLDGPEPMAA